ncbi:carboxypeptidase-like regulatory domain-containing protein [Micromonospora antibiotica]|uniref:Carboxypeptidase regulatory-like domain-containing protein n=1 Tax=Micromonospora antibiotica TaxID=2807623 RepID=A0ABS3V5J2_9ACTN|nr:carboxypeptidase-like regulatory domain-containing protein [Micromonospora antibiotica]MBO4160870.1 carboxypeptidase regulatory-like domain-containing protein [Micromonospora antibiotica]
MTGDGRGPVEAATAALAAWLAGVAGEDVPVGPPTDGGAGLTLWPLALRPARQTRGTGTREPYRFTIRYLVSAAGPTALAGLDRILTAAAGAGEPELVLEAGDPALWVTLGVTPRPALLVDVPAQVTPASPVAPPVLHPLRLHRLALRDLAGRVIGPQQQPLAALRVELVGTPYATHTDAGGRFRIAGVPHDPEHPGRPVRLRLVGRGRTLTAEVDPADADLVIVCEPPAR